MQNQIIILFVGFLLTTVVGGLLGYFFQNRAWKHQNDAKIFDAERAAATKIFEDISSLMDKRLYRMRQLNWKLGSTATEIEIIEGHMNEYRQVLYEWNDNLNRNLALTLRYFGKEIRKDLEGIVYEEFKKIGSLLEKAYSERKKVKMVHSES